MKLRSTLFFAAASLSASALLPVAATTSAFFAASAVPAQAWEIDETTGLPDATLPGTATTVSEEHLVSEDTAYSFTDAGQNSNVNITLSNGAGALLLPSEQNSLYSIGTVSGEGDVWFGGGRWRVQTTGTTNITSTGTLYLSGAQFWVTDGQGAGGAFSTDNDVVLGLSNFSGDGISALDNTALRVDAAVTLNGTTTIIPEGTRIGFQNGKNLTIANLAGSGDIETSAYNNSASTLTISDSSNYTGTISVAPSMTLVWNDADAETVRVANADSSHNSGFTFAEGFDGTVVYSGNLDPTRLTLGENARLELSGSGTNNSTWSGSAGTLSADVLFKTDYTLGHGESAALTLSGNVSADEGTTLTVNKAATFSGETTSLQSFVVNSSGAATFSTGTATIAGSLTSAGTISVSGGSLTIGGNGVTVSLANGIAVSAGATVTVNAGTTFLLDAMTRGEGGVYTLFSGDGTVAAPQSGWTFLLDDVDVATRGTLSADGKTLTVKNYSLTWNGGQSGAWDTTSENWSGESTTFFPGDSVTFATANAVVTVDDVVKPGAMTISAATTFTGATGTVSVAPGSLTIGEGASLTLAGGVTLDFGTVDGTSRIEKTILSSAEDRGRVKIVSTLGGHDTQIRLGEGFNGTLVYSGKLNTDNFTVGADARLELSTSSAGGSIWGNGTINNDILFTSDYRVGDSSNATITLAGNVSADEGTTLTLGGTRDAANATQVNLSGNVAADIVMQEWGTTTFTGAANISALNVSGGTLNFSGNADIGTVNVKGGTVNFAGTATADRITLDNANSSVTVSDNVSTTQYYGTATSARGANTSTISDTGVLNITGTVSSSAGDPASSNAAFALTHWGSTHTFNVAGVLNVANAGISNVDGAGVLNINNGGEANFGAGLWVVNRYGSVTVNLNEGGTLNLGANADGVGINNSNFTLNLNGGTIGSLAESWSSSSNLALGGAVTFDTTQKEINAASAATIVTAAEGGNAGSAITLSGVLSGEGSLTKTGAGTLELNNNNTYSGGTTVEEGTLVARRDGALGSGKVSVTGGDLRIHLNGDGNIVIGSSGKPPSIDVGENGSLTISRGQITVQEGGSVTVDGTFTVSDTLDLGGNAATGRVAVTGGALDLSGANVVIDADADHVTLSGGTLNLSGATVTARAGFAVAGTAVTVDGDTTFVLDNMTAVDGVYTLFTVSSGSVTGFDALDNGNFTLGGVEVGSRGTVNATNYTLTLTTYDNLVWAGGTEGTWNSSDQSWTVGEGGAQTTFFSGDSVTFNTENALVTVEGTLAPDGVTISAATTFTGTGTVSVDSLTIGEGASLTLAEGVTWALAGQQATGENSLLSKFSGAGTVSFATSTDYGNNVLNFADGFTGTAHMTAGNFTINGSKFGSTLVLGDGVNFQLDGGSSVQIGGESADPGWTHVAGSEIVLEGTSQIHQNRGANLTINADVSGSGTYDSQGGGALIFNGNVELGGFIATRSGNCTTTFTGTTTIGTVTVKGGTVNFASSDAEIGALNFTANGGNVVFSLAEGAEETTYTLGAVALDATTSYTRNFSVGEGVTVNATSLANRWGMGALTVDGELNFSGDLKFATGNNNSTENNVIAGTGTIRANSLTFGNIGTYNISVNRIEVGSGGIIYDDNGGNNGVPTVNLGATTIAATESWSSGYGDDVATPRLTLVSARAADEDGVLSGGTFFEVVGADTVAEIEAKIRGEGTLVKTGAGTLTLSGANTLTGTLEVREGTLAAVSAGALGAGDVVVAGGTLEIDGTLVEFASNATLTLEEAGAISVANGARFEILGTLDLDHAIDVAGTVTVGNTAVFVLEWDSEGENSQTFALFDLTSGGTLDWTGLTTDNISVDVSLRGGEAVFNGDGTVTVTTGGSGESITLVWNGGTAGDWNTTETNWSHEGKEERFCAGDNVVFDTDGDVSVSVAPAGVRPGAVTISAGTVSFTGGQVTARDGFFIGGGESSATLKLTANDNIAGDVTVNAGGALDLNGQSEDISEEGLGRLTLNGGSLVNNGRNVGVGSAQITSVALTADSTFGGTGDFGIIARGYAATSLDLGEHTLTKQGANTLHLVNTSVTAGTLAVTAGTVSMTVNAGEVNFAADVEVADDASFTFNMTGGSAMFSGSVDITGTANVSGGGATTFTGAQNTIGDLRFGQATVNFGTENASAGTGISSVTTVGSIVMGHTNNAGTLNVHADAALTVTGSSMSTGGSAGSFMIGNYPQAQTVNVSGALNLQNAGITTRDGTGTVNILEGGEVNFNVGLTTASNNSGAARATVVLESGGRMNIGSGGITESTTLGLTLNGGTIGSLADSWSSSRALTLGGSVTFDTTLMEFNASGKATETEDGSDVTLSGALSGSGSLVKTGEGTLTLSGALSHTGGTTVEAGTLQLLLGGDYASGDISVASGATLQLSSAGDAVNFGGTADAPVTLTLGEGSVLSGGEGTVNLTAGTTLAFTGADGSSVDASGATLTYRSGEGGGTLIFADDREFGAFVFDSQGAVSSAGVGRNATLSAGELSFADSANRGAEMSGAGTLAVGKISVNNTRSGNEISVGTLELTQAETEISVARNGSLEISSDKIVFSEGVEDGTLVKTGAGTLTVGDAFQDDFAGSLRVDAGTVSTNLLNLSGALTLAAGTTFDGSVDAAAGSSVGLGAGARIDGDLTLTDATATFGAATVTGDLTVSGTEMTFNGTVSGIGTLTWGDGNGINLGEAFRAEISSAGNGVLLDFNVGLDGDGNALTEDFDFDFDASALADSFLGRDVDLVYNENDTSIEIVVTGALVWNETVTHWTVSGAGGSGHEHDQWDVVTRDGVSEESAFFENGDFVQFTTAGSTRLVGTVNGGSSFAGKGTEPLGDGIVRTAGIVFDIEGGGTFTLDSKKRYNGDGELVDDGQSVLNSTAQGKDEGITVLNGSVTIGKNVVNNLVGGTKIYGGSLTVYAADALGKGAIEVGDAASATRATLTFAQEGTLNVARTVSVGNANAQIGVTNAAAVVSLDRVEKNAAAEEGAALTKLGAGTLNIGRGDYEAAELLDRVAVNAGTLTFTGDAGELPTRNVSVASGATLNVEHGGDAVAFDAMDVAGTVTVGSAQGAARGFSAGTISATGTAGKISGALQLDGASFEAETAGVATTYKGTLFYAEDADQNLAFTGTVSAAADSDAALYKAGAGTVSFASGTTEKFRLDADLTLDGGTVSFGEGVEASGALRVTGVDTRVEVSRTDSRPTDGKSSFSGGLTVDALASVTFMLGNGMWTTDSVSGETIGLTLYGDIAAENGGVAFASTGGSSARRGTVSIENAESATFRQLTVGGTGTNIVDLSVGDDVDKFSAYAVALYGASSLNFENPQEGEATIGALQVIDNAGNAAELDLGGGTLSLENDVNVAVLYGDGTLRISNGTLNVSGQNYSEEHTPGIVLVDGATFNFDVAENGAAAYSSLREITTEGSGGTVSKSGAGTLVLYLDDETGQPVSGDITFDGVVKLDEGETHLYATLADADLSVADAATLRLFTTAKTAEGGNAPEGVSLLAKTISGAGTIAVSGVLHANGGLQNFTGALHANGGTVVAYEALSGAATAGGNDAFAGSIRLSDGGVLAAAENVTIATVDVDGKNAFTSVEGASLTVEEVSATAGTSLSLAGAGTLKNAAFAAPAEGETATNGISVSGDWTLAGAATGVDSVSVNGALTLGSDSAIDADAALSVSAGGTLTFEKAEAYANKISLNGGTVAADAGAGKTVSLTNVSAGAGSVFSAESGTLSVSAANLGDGASALRFEAAADAVVRLVVADDRTLDGVLSGAGTFEKAGAGTLTLDSGSHDVANIAVSAGTLSVGSDAAFSGKGTLTVADGATLKSDDGQLSGFTLTGEGTATVSGELGGIENAADVALDGALSVSGNVSGSALAFEGGASLKGAGTTVSGTTLSGGTVTLETLTVAEDSTFADDVSTLKLQGQAGTSGAVAAAFAGSLEKSGDGTWTVSDYSAESGDRLKVSAGTLVWKNADFAKGSTITADGTLRIEGAATETLAGTIGGRGTLELRNTNATLDIEAASGASWTLNVAGTSAVTVNAALPGALRVGDKATATLVLEEDATLKRQLNIASSGATLVKAGAGTLTVDTSSATSPHNIFGTLRVEEGAVSQKTAMSWMNNSVLDIDEDGTFIVDLGSDAAKSSAKLTGTGTLEIASTGADGYTLEGSVKAFAGTLNVADGATLNLRNGVFADGATVTVEEGGVLAFMGREGGVIDGVSGAGTLRVDMAVTPGADSSYLTGAYVYGDNAGFEGSVEVKSGILSVSAEDFATLAGRTLSVGGDGSAAALYVDDGLSAGGVARGAFLRLSGGGDLNGAFEGFESRVKENGGVLLSGGSFSAASDFGSETAGRQLYVAEKGAQLTLSDGASVGGSLFVASGAELVLGTAAASSAPAAGTQTFAAEDAGTVLPDGVSGVSGDFTLNGKLTCLVSDATNLSAPLLAVAGTTTVNTAANKKAFKPEIVLDVGGFSGSLEGLTIVDSGEGVVSGAGSINQYVSVTDSAGGKWVVVKNPDGSLALSSGTQDGYGVSGNMSGLFNALYSEEEGSFFQKELSDKQGGELTSALVSLSPVSFGSLIEMQSGFASLENDLLRERLEQRRYERTFASDRSTKFKPFVNILGADREGDGDGTDAANYDITHAGAIGGFDFAVSDNTIVGVSIGVDWAKADLKDGAGKHEGEGSRIGLYGMTVFENAYVGYGLSAGGMSFDTKRRYGDRTMTGDTDGNDVNATLLFGAGWTLSDAYGIDLAPYVGLDIGYVTADSFTESGSADTALDTDSIDRWSLRGKIGATLSWRATDRLRIGLDAMFAHEFGDSDIDIDAKIGGNAFSSKAYLMDENTIQIGPRIDFRIDDTWSVSAAYAFETDLDETTTHSANLGVRARF